MPRFIIKLKDKETKKDFYLDYSTIVDAPITYGMALTEFKEYYLNEYGEDKALELEERLERVEKKGCSAVGYTTLSELLLDDEKYLLKKYCLNRD